MHKLISLGRSFSWPAFRYVPPISSAAFYTSSAQKHHQQARHPNRPHTNQPTHHTTHTHLLDAVAALAQVLQQPNCLRPHPAIIIPRQQLLEHPPAQLPQQQRLQLRPAAKRQVFVGPERPQPQLWEHAGEESSEGLWQAVFDEGRRDVGEVQGEVAGCRSSGDLWGRCAGVGGVVLLAAWWYWWWLWLNSHLS